MNPVYLDGKTFMQSVKLDEISVMENVSVRKQYKKYDEVPEIG